LAQLAEKILSVKRAVSEKIVLAFVSTSDNLRSSLFCERFELFMIRAVSGIARCDHGRDHVQQIYDTNVMATMQIPPQFQV
jgi:hypothetical protein